VHAGFWWGRLSERAHLVDLGVLGVIIVKLIVTKQEGTRGLD
jgi:hypothetical protein